MADSKINKLFFIETSIPSPKLQNHHTPPPPSVYINGLFKINLLIQMESGGREAATEQIQRVKI